MQKKNLEKLFGGYNLMQIFLSIGFYYLHQKAKRCSACTFLLLFWIDQAKNTEMQNKYVSLNKLIQGV